MLGGYVMLNKADENLYLKAKNALTQGKPILWYEAENTCYYIDTISLDGTDVVLTKGGKIITIESDGDIVETGDFQNHLYLVSVNFSYQVDINNNDDFIVELLLSKYENITFDDIYNSVALGHIFINDNKDILCYTNDIQNNSIAIKYLDGTSWTTYGNDLTANTISNISVSMYKQIF